MIRIAFGLSAALFAGMATAETCFKTGEQVSGMNKLCYYKCLSGVKVLNLSSIDLCPLSADFSQPMQRDQSELTDPQRGAPTRHSPGRLSELVRES